MHRPKSRPLLALALAALCLPAAAFAEPGDMMRMNVSIKMQIAGMSINIPPRTVSKDVCVSRQRDPNEYVNQSRDKGDCKISNFQRSGGNSTFHYECTGDMAIKGEAKFSDSAGGIHGAIHADGSVHGQPVTVDFTYEGTPTGTACEAKAHDK